MAPVGSAAPPRDWPALLPVTFYLASSIDRRLPAVHPAYLLTAGGPADATLTTALYTYQAAFWAGELGYASALTVILFAAVLLLTIVLFRKAGPHVQYLGAEA